MASALKLDVEGIKHAFHNFVVCMFVKSIYVECFPSLFLSYLTANFPDSQNNKTQTDNNYYCV